MNSDFCSTQLKICDRVQRQVIAAIEAGDFNSAVVLSEMLKNLTGSYKDLAEEPRQALGAAIGRLRSSNPSSAPQTKVPSIPTSYAYPDGFEGVTLNPDAWSSE